MDNQDYSYRVLLKLRKLTKRKVVYAQVEESSLEFVNEADSFFPGIYIPKSVLPEDDGVFPDLLYVEVTAFAKPGSSLGGVYIDELVKRVADKIQHSEPDHE